MNTLQDLITFFEKSEENKQTVFSWVSYALKERERYRVKDKKSREKKKAVRIANGEVIKSRGRPRKDVVTSQATKDTAEQSCCVGAQCNLSSVSVVIPSE